MRSLFTKSKLNRQIDALIFSLISNPRYTDEVTSQCLSVLRNLSCYSDKKSTVARSEDLDDYNIVFNGLSEQVLFDMLEAQMTKGIDIISKDVSFVISPLKLPFSLIKFHD